MPPLDLHGLLQGEIYLLNLLFCIKKLTTFEILTMMLLKIKSSGIRTFFGLFNPEDYRISP
jgi:hypothetical protein